MPAVYDDTEEPLFEVSPTDNVYSYFMFITPTEKKKEGSSFTTDVIMAWLLIAFNFFFQGVLVYTVFNEVVIENVEWQNGITGAGGGLKLFSGSPAGGFGGENCNEGESLCFFENGRYSCAPPSVQLTGRWDELDVNGDGIWTRAEVEEKREELKCKYVVDPMEVFDVFHKFLLKRRGLIWLHPDVVAGKVIHKPYFIYAKGDLIMCGYRDESMCPNLLERGVFNAPLAHGTSPRVGKTIDSALDYCTELLRSGGTCQRSLPSTYATWRIDSVQQCGEKSYEKFSYSHPGTGNTKSLLAVSHEAPENFKRSQTAIFMMYKGVIIFLWLLAIQFELKEILIIVTWVLRFPDAEQFGEDAVKEEPDPLDPGDVKYIIQGITWKHRIGVGALIFFRLLLTLVLGFVGVSFLSKQTEYVKLLLDGVALIFIMEIATILYQQVLRDDIRDQTESLTAMRVRMFGWEWLNRRPAVADIVWLTVMVILIVIVMWLLNTMVFVPVGDALDCACLSTGESCHEYHAFSNEFWDKYWLEDVPGVYADVARLGGGAVPRGVSLDVEAPPADAPGSAAPGAPGAPAVVFSGGGRSGPIRMLNGPRFSALQAGENSTAAAAEEAWWRGLLAEERRRAAAAAPAVAALGADAGAAAAAARRGAVPGPHPQRSEQRRGRARKSELHTSK